MKKLFFVLCAVLTICTAVVPTFATEYVEQPADGSTDMVLDPFAESSENSVDGSFDISADVVDGSTIDGVTEEETPPVSGGEVVVYETTVAETPDNTKVTTIIPPDDSGPTPGTMSAVISSVFGEYQRQQYQITEYDSTGNIVGTSYEYVDGLAGIDWPWVCGVLLFVILLYSFLRLIGVVVKR